MKTVSIDAVRQRKVEIEGKIAIVIAAAQAINDRAANEKRDLTEAEASDFCKQTEAMKPLKAALAREDFILGEVAAALEREKNATGLVLAGDGTPTARGADGKPIPLWVKGFAQQLQAVVRHAKGMAMDPRLTGVYGDFDASGVFQASGGSDGAMNEAVPSEGGFLVGSDFSAKIYQRTYSTGSIVSRCTRQPISANSNRLTLNVVDEDSRADGSRMGGVLAFWANEADTFLSTRPKFRQINLFLNKLTALVFATDELLEDAAALEAWIMNNLPTELAFRVEDAIFLGSGAGQPAGITLSKAFQALSPGSTASVINGTDVIAMMAQFWFPGILNTIPAYSTENLTPDGGPRMPAAAWFIDQSTIPQVWNLQQPALTAGAVAPVILLYHPPGSNPLFGPYGELMGLPVIPTEHNAALGTVGDIILADMSQVLLADKGTPKVASSMHVRFVQGEMAFRFTLRVDAQTTWKKPLTPKSGGPTLSPFIGLASGASR